MTGRERIVKVLSGEAAPAIEPPPILPMMHTGLATLAGVPLGTFFTDASAMADVMVTGVRRFGFDGVQLSLGVTGEAEALGARVEQPADAAPVLAERLLANPDDLDRLRDRDPGTGGRIPMFIDALARTSRAIGDEAFILATLRGPLLIASQLRAVEDLLIDMIERPEDVERILDFTTAVAARVAQATLAGGADGLLLGEATCSPNFISPDMYRRLVLPFHTRLVRQLEDMGWRFVGLHVCGNIVPIIEDLVSTGVDFFDVDYQVPAAEAIRLAAGRVALRGNIDPSSVLRFGTADDVRRQTQELCRCVRGHRWIAGSGCDVPPGTPAENVDVFVETIRASAPR